VRASRGSDADNPAILNAEIQALDFRGAEICVDLALLDLRARSPSCAAPSLSIEIQGRHVFGAGINLTHLYHGRIPFVGISSATSATSTRFTAGSPSPTMRRPTSSGGGHDGEALDRRGRILRHRRPLPNFAGHGLRARERGAFLTLPARKEGIIPGAANMRLPRFTGDRIARQAIQYERRLDCDSPEGRLICDEIVPTGGDGRSHRACGQGLTNSGVVSAAGNRRAFSHHAGAAHTFPRLCAVYAREQPYCHFSPALIANLERYWNAQSASLDAVALLGATGELDCISCASSVCSLPRLRGRVGEGVWCEGICCAPSLSLQPKSVFPTSAGQ